MKHLYGFEHLPKELQKKFEIYQETLTKWNSRINLVSRTTLSELWTRHFEDSLQLFPFLRGENILDVGSGAGFPGMVLAIAGQSQEFLIQENYHPPLKVTCIDSDSRKITFLNEVARLTETNVSLVCDRVEKLNSSRYDTIVARGFANLTNSLKLIEKLSNYFVFLKGEKFQKEIEEAQKYFSFECKIYDSSTDPRGKIVVIANLKLI